MNVIWSERARDTYFKILDHLAENWSRHEINQFINRTDVVINTIRKHPGILAYTGKH